MADSPFDQVEPIYIDIEFVVLIFFCSRGWRLLDRARVASAAEEESIPVNRKNNGMGVEF